MEGRQSLEALLQGDECGGAEALEFFWLFKASRDDCVAVAQGASAALEADGLAVFQHKKASVQFGQLLHVSLAGEDFDKEAFLDALTAVKTWMFACLPIKGIRTTLWYSTQDDDSYAPYPPLLAAFKSCFFRWFQLKNTTDGRRGQVMNRPRGSPDDGDPEPPAEAASIRICWGQTWLRAARALDASATRRIGTCAWNLILAALCLNDLWGRDATEAAKIVDWDVVAARSAKATTQEALVRGLLSGNLPKLLASFAPAALGPQVRDPMNGGRAKSYASKAMSAELACHLAKSMETGTQTVPCSQCEAGENIEEMVRRLSTGAGFAEFCAGAGLESLPRTAVEMRARDAAFGRLFVTSDWHRVRIIDEQTFEVPVDAAGKCPWHPHPICYLQTTDDDMYVVIIPWSNAPDVPREEDAFTACTEILRAIQPLDPPPVSSVRMPNFCATSPVRMTEIESSSAILQQKDAALHVAEFGSLLLTSGRAMPGRLPPAPPSWSSAPPLMLEKPYILGFWHAGLDALNVPLAAMLVA